MLATTDLVEATKAIESLPLVKAGVLATGIIPLKPYVGFERLFAKYGDEPLPT